MIGSNVVKIMARSGLIASALRRVRGGALAGEIFKVSPCLSDFTEALIWHISDKLKLQMFIDVDSPPLVDLFLKTALEWAYFSEQREGDYLENLQTAFLAGLLYHVEELTHSIVRSPSGDWDLFGSEPLTDWVVANPNWRLVFTTKDDPVRQMHASEIRLALVTLISRDGSVFGLKMRLEEVLNPGDDLMPTGKFNDQ